MATGMSVAGTLPPCVPPAKDAVSPNHGARRGGIAPSLIVLHYTGMTDAASARARLCDPAAEVSAHWLLCEDGSAEPLVPEDRRAWHAGAGAWQGRDDINSHSIGIEMVNPGDRPFPAAQMHGLIKLLHAIRDRWGLGPEAVIAHSDLAPARKQDPGPRFDWRRLDLLGLAICPAPIPPTSSTAADPLRFDALLDRIGYPPEATPARLGAFRARFRPWGEGPLSPSDLAQAAAVADAHDRARHMTVPR